MPLARAFPLTRGIVIEIGKDDYILFTKGWIRFLETYHRLGVPTPLEIVEHHGNTPLKVLFEEILALTKMN